MLLGGRRWSRRTVAVAIAVAIAILAAAVSTFFFGSWPGGQSGPQRAAIVDQLSLTTPNPDFVATTTAMLEGAGYQVDYYLGEEVTVDFYRNLPTLDYDVLVLRVHSGLIEDDDGQLNQGAAFLFTSERYDQQKYLEEQRARRLIVATYLGRYDLESPLAGRLEYFQFGIPSDFIKSSMKGRFNDATVILMGCNGLTSGTMAEAFVERGAETVVSWDGLVSAPHTDVATERLLEHLVVENHTAREAVTRTMAEFGPDPWYDSKLLSYPPES